MQYFSWFLFLTISVFLEAAWITLPITLCLLLVFYIMKKDSTVFFMAFIAGILLDLARVGSLGQSSIFFLTCLFIVFLYEKKFEIKTYAFVFFSSFLGSFVYLFLGGYNDIFLQSLVAAFLASIVFLIIRRFSRLTPFV